MHGCCSEVRLYLGVSDESLRSNSDSDLSNPEAELCEAILCLGVSSSELEETTSSIGEIDTGYGCIMDFETYFCSLGHESSDFSMAHKIVMSIVMLMFIVVMKLVVMKMVVMKNQIIQCQHV